MVSDGPPNPAAREKLLIFDLFPEGASGVFSGAREAVLGSLLYLIKIIVIWEG